MSNNELTKKQDFFYDMSCKCGIVKAYREAKGDIFVMSDTRLVLYDGPLKQKFLEIKVPDHIQKQVNELVAREMDNYIRDLESELAKFQMITRPL